MDIPTMSQKTTTGDGEANQQPTRYIYKIVSTEPHIPLVSSSSTSTAEESQARTLPPDFALPSSELDKASGFMHMSTSSQIPGTLFHFFATSTQARNSVYLLRVDYSSLEDRQYLPEPKITIRWETPDASICGPREGEGMFPHIYLKNLDGSALQRKVGDEHFDTSSGLGVHRDGLPVLAGRNVVDHNSGVVLVDSAVELMSGVGEEGWDVALSRVRDWLV